MCRILSDKKGVFKLFTGIIEEKGKIISMKRNGPDTDLVIGACKVLEGTEIGDSISVNGVCLTVTNIKESSFTAFAMAETMRRTAFSEFKPGDQVNLERAMAAGGRFGGHIVSGHIDGTGTIVSERNEGKAVWVTVGAPPEILRYIVEKGSVAIDGISLTVAEVNEKSFSVSIIPHTGEASTLLTKKKGSHVNLENDIIGKYVERFVLCGDQEGPYEKKFRNSAEPVSRGLTAEELIKAGF